MAREQENKMKVAIVKTFKDLFPNSTRQLRVYMDAEYNDEYWTPSVLYVVGLNDLGNEIEHTCTSSEFSKALRVFSEGWYLGDDCYDSETEDYDEDAWGAKGPPDHIDLEIYPIEKEV